MTTISRNEEMSTYQNVDIGGLEAKSWEILNENTALEVKTQSGKALQTSDEPQQCAQHNNGQSKSAGHQEVGSNTISPNNPHKNESETDKQYENGDENGKEPDPDEEVTTNCDESHNAETRQPDRLDKPQGNSNQQLINCKGCDKRCHKEGELEKHVQVHDGQQLVSCHFCNKIIDQSSNMEKHNRRLHTRNLPHECKNCEVELVNNTTIMNHSTDMHGAENPKECGNCDNICSNRTISEKHVSTHSSVKNYKCTDCAQTVTRMKHMLTPKSYEHEANP